MTLLLGPGREGHNASLLLLSEPRKRDSSPRYFSSLGPRKRDSSPRYFSSSPRTGNNEAMTLLFFSCLKTSINEAMTLLFCSRTSNNEAMTLLLCSCSRTPREASSPPCRPAVEGHSRSETGLDLGSRPGEEGDWHEAQGKERRRRGVDGRREEQRAGPVYHPWYHGTRTVPCYPASLLLPGYTPAPATRPDVDARVYGV